MRTLYFFLKFGVIRNFINPIQVSEFLWIIARIYNTFDSNFEIKNDFQKHLKEC